MSSTGRAQSISSEEQSSRVTRAWALLRRAFETGTHIEQVNVMFAVAGIESPEGMSWLEQVARSNSPARAVAVGELARSGRPEVVPLLREALADPDRDVRRRRWGTSDGILMQRCC
jgi:HEAT repeat protein